MRRGDRGMRPRRSDARVRTPNRRQPATGNGERARDVSAGEKVKRNREVDGREERALGRERGRTSASNAASALSTSPVIFENSVMTTTSVSQDPRCGQIWAVELTPVNRHFAKSCQKLQKADTHCSFHSARGLSPSGPWHVAARIRLNSSTQDCWSTEEQDNPDIQSIAL
jgi:hypothetical protein